MLVAVEALTCHLTPQAFRAQIASGATDPVYVIVGDDEHEKSALALALGEMVEEDLRAFNVERMYAVDTAVTPIVVAEAARTLPMMAPRRVVIVLQAEKLFDPKKKRKAADADCRGRGDGRIARAARRLPGRPVTDDGAGVRLLEPRGSQGRRGHPAGEEPQDHQGPAEGGDARRVHGTRRRQGSGALDPAAGVSGRADRGSQRGSHAILQLSGGDSGRLRADVEKLLLFAAGAGQLTLDHVAAVVGAPAHHGDDWALVRAIEQGDAAGALRELQAALDVGGVPFQILGQIGYAVRTPPPRGRFPARRVPAAVDALLRTDLALKSSGGDPRVLLERLVVELCG